MTRANVGLPTHAERSMYLRERRNGGVGGVLLRAEQGEGGQEVQKEGILVGCSSVGLEYV
jgi:hypothetical protein